MQLMRKHTRVKIGLPTPTWLLKMGAMLINTETELVLKSRWVLPERLLQIGYEFKYPNMENALKDILNN